MPIVVRPVDLASAQLLAHPYRLEHRTVAEATASDVVDLSDTRLGEEFAERADKVGAVNVVAHLLALVSVHDVRGPGHRALHQIRKKPVELRARMVRTGETASPETTCP